MIDPDGMETQSTIVKFSNGKFIVSGGDANDGDRGIYLDNGSGGKGARVGQSITTHSFMDSEGKPVMGAQLDPNSTEGTDFIDKLEHDNPSLLSYMWNGQNRGDYDLKSKGIDERGDISRSAFMYRGSKNKDGDYGSARDYGNIGAGLVAARKGLTWDQARMGFDTYQGFKSDGVSLIGTSFTVPTIGIIPVREPATTVKAQMVGYRYGLKKYK